MVANPVPVSKICVGIVVEGAPSDGAAEIGIRERIVQDPGVAEGLLQTPWLRIGGFRGEHVPIVLSYQNRMLAFDVTFRIVQTLRKVVAKEVVVPVDVLEEFGILEIPDPEGLAVWV